MEKGTYRGRRVNFNDYAVESFSPCIFSEPARARLGCGISALALLTGTYPEKITSRRRSQHCSDAVMVRFLRAQGFRTLRLTQCHLSQSDTEICGRHVVLLSQLFRPNEGTWLVLYNGMCFHNFDLFSLGLLSFLNKPILSAHLVVHPSWRLCPMPKPTPASQVKPPPKGITIHALCRSGLAGNPER